MAVLEKTKKTKLNKYGIKKLKPKKIDTSKNCVICFPGDGAVEPRQANYYAKMVEDMISKNMSNVYSFYYDKPPTEKERFKQFIESNLQENYRTKFSVGFNKKQVEEFVEKVMTPLFLDGKKIVSKEKAKENFSKLTFFSHCHGMKEVASVLNLTASEMKKCGFSQENTTEILSKVLNISFSPHIDKTAQTKYGMHIKFYSLDDDVFGSKIKEKYNKSGVYFGVGKTFLEDNNLVFVTDSFYGSRVLDNKLKIHKKIPNDDHDISSVNVNDKDYVHRGYQRVQTVFDLISSCLALAVASKNLSLSDYETMVKNQIALAEQTDFEKQDKKYFLHGNPKITSKDYLKNLGIDEQDILDGKVSLVDAFTPAYKKEIINYLDFSDAKISLDVIKSIYSSYQKNDLGKKIFSKNDYNFIKRWGTPEQFIFEDGSFYEYTLPREKIKEIQKANLVMSTKNAVGLMENNFHTLEKKKEKSHNVLILQRIERVERNKNATTFKELFEVKEKNKEPVYLTPQQTRFVLNAVIAYDIALKDLKIEEGIFLDEKVLREEVKVLKNGKLDALQKSKVKGIKKTTSTARKSKEAKKEEVLFNKN